MLFAQCRKQLWEDKTPYLFVLVRFSHLTKKKKYIGYNIGYTVGYISKIWKHKKRKKSFLKNSCMLTKTAFI